MEQQIILDYFVLDATSLDSTDSNNQQAWEQYFNSFGKRLSLPKRTVWLGFSADRFILICDDLPTNNYGRYRGIIEK